MRWSPGNDPVGNRTQGFTDLLLRKDDPEPDCNISSAAAKPSNIFILIANTKFSYYFKPVGAGATVLLDLDGLFHYLTGSNRNFGGDFAGLRRMA